MPETEKTVLTARPAIFRVRPVKTPLLIFALVGSAALAQNNPSQPLFWGLPAVCGLILLSWLVDALGTSLRVTDRRSILSRGILAKRTREVRHSDVRLLEVEQSFFQRLLGVGAIAVGSAGHGDVEIRVAGIRAPYRIKETINELRP